MKCYLSYILFLFVTFSDLAHWSLLLFFLPHVPLSYSTIGVTSFVLCYTFPLFNFLFSPAAVPFPASSTFIHSFIRLCSVPSVSLSSLFVLRSSQFPFTTSHVDHSIGFYASHPPPASPHLSNALQFGLRQ